MLICNVCSEPGMLSVSGAALESDIELGNLPNVSPAPGAHEASYTSAMPPTIAPDATNHRHRVLEALSKALDVLDRVA